MGAVAVIGTQPQVGGFALAGAHVYPADTAEEVRAAWHALPATAAFVVLTQSAAESLGDELERPGAPLTVVIPR